MTPEQITAQRTLRLYESGMVTAAEALGMLGVLFDVRLPSE